MDKTDYGKSCPRSKRGPTPEEEEDFTYAFEDIDNHENSEDEDDEEDNFVVLFNGSDKKDNQDHTEEENGLIADAFMKDDAEGSLRARRKQRVKQKGSPIIKDIRDLISNPTLRKEMNKRKNVSKKIVY